MSFSEILYSILIKPLQLFFEVLFLFVNRITNDPGLSIIALSLAMNFLVLPLYRRADALQEEERETEKRLGAGVAHIKKTFKGDERMMILQTYYRQNNYKPTDVFKGSMSLFLEIPFFVAAYQFLSKLELLEGVSFYFISDLGAEDGLLNLAGHAVNLLPVVMTSVNLISCVIFTRGYPRKTKIQLYSMAIFFLVFLYRSPAGLVFYWTLNNLFSLVKTIFYKLKHPGKVLRALFAVIGTATALYGAFIYTGELKFKLFIAAVGAVCIFPLAAAVIGKKIKLRLKLPEYKADKRVFWVCMAYLTVLVGCVIPTAVLKTSPEEFCDVDNFVNPLWYMCSSLCLSVGTFIVWMGVFYSLADEKGRGLFDMGAAAACAVATTDYMCFGNDLGMLNCNLQFDDIIVYSNTEILINLCVVVIVVVVAAMICRLKNKLIKQVISVACAALALMGCLNMYSISSAVKDVASGEVRGGMDTPSFTLSTSGKNVVVIMLDRALSQVFPYIVNEKPELTDALSGFTYYPNTLSYGMYTNFATPALYGGYEYRPEKINERSGDKLVDKQNEALRVMPCIFSDNGYEVTVCDPPYANYKWTPYLSIYDDYPSIRTYHTEGKFAEGYSKENNVAFNKRNFFLYSIMKIVPLRLQTMIYEKGKYNNAQIEMSKTGIQIRKSLYTAEGIGASFDKAITVLENLDTMTEIVDGEKNTFLMLSNNSTHEPVMLQEPEYTEAVYVDNTEYEATHSDRFVLNGRPLIMTGEIQYTHYQVNMSAILRLAEWMKYLKQNGVYDNTRIIIVSDHGRDTDLLGDMIVNFGDASIDAGGYCPLLLVKDFNSDEFTVSEEFMTNADVPTIAFSGLIEEPVNPATGNAINSEAKGEKVQYVFGSGDWNVKKNGRSVFNSGPWYAVHTDVRDPANWEKVQDDSISPLAVKKHVIAK